ncbi:DUF3558 domain-containing protein [Saccharothrix sp. HUAS TT1]|uniref:DUF3558 domain-containing protein n=1 Tax=unclassified Saccharothrix TaxID=2593673 RepID=UPI00345B84EB
MNRRTTLAAVAVVLSVLTACGTGEPESAPATGTTTAPQFGPVKGGPLDGADPCALLTKAEAEQVTGAQTAEPAVEQLGAAKVCNFSPEKARLGVGIRTSTGLDAVQSNGNPVDEITIGRHRAKQAVGATGSCGIFIGVTDSSRVDVVLNSGSPDEDPCPAALRVAELVEPRLP